MGPDGESISAHPAGKCAQAVIASVGRTCRRKGYITSCQLGRVSSAEIAMAVNDDGGTDACACSRAVPCCCCSV